jgi:hypothetical protein
MMIREKWLWRQDFAVTSEFPRIGRFGSEVRDGTQSCEVDAFCVATSAVFFRLELHCLTALASRHVSE